MFGGATIRLGIGPHSSVFCCANKYTNNKGNVYGAINMTIAFARVHLVHVMYTDSAPGGRQTSGQANRFGL